MHTYYLLPFKLPLYQTFLDIQHMIKVRYLIPAMYSHFSKVSLKIQVRMNLGGKKKKNWLSSIEIYFSPSFKELSVINSTF